MAPIALKRVYEPAEPEDGTRVLVDRLWPRGLRKDKADIDLWAKDVAPSTALRRWFGHRPERWQEFEKRYRAELAAPEAQTQVEALRAMTRKGRVTLLYAAHDESMNNAVVLRDYLRKRH
ncbi:DUF488 domain-containing protein [Methylocystis suflitae]|uniref:DUF488 domain-containing protein n=1 Tax=Methylocystis suflitae TaxID=2951405 RepID=UPI00210924AC|nr:DUF488 domain-containing protein [Methylocystis suflitae]MCQ4190151.1 DUF488 domain-containing protein [Methylocystis suflitae]